MLHLVLLNGKKLITVIDLLQPQITTNTNNITTSHTVIEGIEDSLSERVKTSPSNYLENSINIGSIENKDVSIYTNSSERLKVQKDGRCFNY